jgi:hypothetical protein|tara:strand:- start:14 stop:637 length:624 start_codon:yes stop_codon:yes gene_type:complete
LIAKSRKGEAPNFKEVALPTMAMEHATFRVSEDDLEFLVLEKTDLASEFRGHQLMREGLWDNARLARYAFASSTASRFSRAGRVTGYIREFGPTAAMTPQDGFDFLAATAAHLFDGPQSVVDWMHHIFLNDFQENVGEEVGQGQQIISVQRLEPANFYDEAVALRVLQGDADGLMSSTIVDFRVGRADLFGASFYPSPNSLTTSSPT